jgi:hypothetical protein
MNIHGLRWFRVILSGVLLGVAFVPAAIYGQAINCHDDDVTCENVWNGSGCSTGCIGMSDPACCAYNEWRCVGTEKVYRTRTCNVVGKVYCTNLNGGYQCSIFQVPPSDPQ